MVEVDGNWIASWDASVGCREKCEFIYLKGELVGYQRETLVSLKFAEEELSRSLAAISTLSRMMHLSDNRLQ